MSLQSTTDANFKQDVLDAKGLVLVDFWAEWCGPCRSMLPILEATAVELGSQVKIVKVNIDENPQAPSQYGVRSIPTLFLFKDGTLVANKVGLVQQSSLVEWIKAHA